MSPSTHSSGFNSQHSYQSGWFNQESRLVTPCQLWWYHTIYGNTTWALWLPLDVLVWYWVGTAPHPTTGTSPERVWLLSAHTCPSTCIPGLKEKIPTRAQACCRLGDLQLSQWEKPLKTSFLYLLCAAAGLKEKVPAIVKSQMMTVQQWCWNLYKSLTLFFNQYKLKIAEQCDLDEY